MSYAPMRIEPLGKENFDTWKIQMQALLTKNDAWCYVSGTVPRPRENAELWDASDSKAKADIVLAMCPTELKQIKDCQTSKSVWDKLHTVYQSQGPARKAMLLKRLILHKMREGEDMKDHVRNFFDVVDKLEEMELNIVDDLLTILLLYSIPETYDSFRIAIETQDKLPTPEALKVKMIEEFEARRRGNNENVSDAMIAKRENRTNHERKKFVKDAASEPFKFKCYKCGLVGHKANKCYTKNYEKKGKPSKREYTASSGEMSMRAETAGTVTTNARGRWCLDSGASSHMCSHIEKFKGTCEAEDRTLNLASRDSTKIAGLGTVKVRVSDELTAKLEKTLFVPDLRSNLLSVGKMTDRGLVVNFHKNGAAVINPKTGKIIMRAKREAELYYVNEPFEEATVANSRAVSLSEWHERFGHLNEADLKDLIFGDKVRGITIPCDKKMPVCEICVQGKLTRAPFPKADVPRGSDILEVVHTDICGPMRVPSLNGSKYFVTFIDDASGWCEIYFMKKRSEVLEKFKEFKSLAEKWTGKKIKILRSDNGTEYRSKIFEQFLREEGIQHQLSVEYTPEQNGVAERKNRTLVEMARCMIIQSGLSQVFWAEATFTANYLRNRCPSRTLDGETPYKLWTGKNPGANHLRTFGTKLYILDKTPQKSKFEPRSKVGILVGYSTVSKAYRIWDPKSRKILRSRDVKFIADPQPSIADDFFDGEIFEQEGTEDAEIPQVELHLMPSQDNPDEEEEVEHPQPPPGLQRGRGRPKILRTGRKGRPKKLFHMVPEELQEDGNEMRHEEDEIAGTIKLADPETLEDALSSPEAAEWRQAMLEEFQALQKNQTWILVDRPPRCKTIDSKWVLRTKFKANGLVERRKARLVMRGFSQRPGIDYDETFAPVARVTSIRMMMAIAVELGLEVHQLDFVSAYLNGNIEEEIYMEIPEGLHEEKSSKTSTDRVCLIKRAMYGLKQSGRRWYLKLHQKLTKLGLKPLESDPCIYVQNEEEEKLMIAIYVDDLIVASNDTTRLNVLKKELSKTFEMKDLGRLHYCLGIEFNQSKDKRMISMCQKKYIQDLLKRFGMEDCKPTTTPMNPSIKLSKEMSSKTDNEREEMERVPYQSLIGSLMYLAVSTRPDIAHAVSALSQFNVGYGSEHWTAAKRVLRYLKGTGDFGLVYEKTGKDVVGFADADWGASVDDRRSYTGYMFKFANAAVSWESRKQATVAMSSTEAEYMALSEAAKEAIHLRRFSSEILGDQGTIVIFNDNQGAGRLTKNPIFHKRTKHIDIRHHFVREATEREEVKVEYLSTEEMPADALTKGLFAPKHTKCIEEFGLKLIFK